MLLTYTSKYWRRGRERGRGVEGGPRVDEVQHRGGGPGPRQAGRLRANAVEGVQGERVHQVLWYHGGDGGPQDREHALQVRLHDILPGMLLKNDEWIFANVENRL